MSTEWRPNPAAVTAVRRHAVDAVEAAARAVLEQAQRNVPVLTGALRESGVVKAEGLAATIAFTDPISVIVHEDQTAHHEHGSAKYLEHAMNTQTAKALESAADELRKAFR